MSTTPVSPDLSSTNRVSFQKAWTAGLSSRPKRLFTNAKALFLNRNNTFSIGEDRIHFGISAVEISPPTPLVNPIHMPQGATAGDSPRQGGISGAGASSAIPLPGAKLTFQDRLWNGCQAVPSYFTGKLKYLGFKADLIIASVLMLLGLFIPSIGPFAGLTWLIASLVLGPLFEFAGGFFARQKLH